MINSDCKRVTIKGDTSTNKNQEFRREPEKSVNGNEEDLNTFLPFTLNSMSLVDLAKVSSLLR